MEELEADFISAASAGHLSTCKLLLNAGVNINASNEEGTALLLAIVNDNLEVCKYLIDKGANIHCKDEDGYMPLHCLYEHKDAEVTKLLLQNGAAEDINMRTISNRMPLHIAAEGDCPEIIDLLIQYGADVEAKDEYGYTPLCCAADARNAENIEALLNNGANPDVINGDGNTPLHMIIAAGGSSSNAVKCVNTLIKGGASLGITNKQGKTPLLKAGSVGDMDVLNAIFFSDATKQQKEGMFGEYKYCSDIIEHSGSLKIILCKHDQD